VISGITHLEFRASEGGEVVEKFPLLLAIRAREGDSGVVENLPLRLAF